MSEAIPPPGPVQGDYRPNSGVQYTIMGFYQTILAHRRLAAILIAVVVLHILLLIAAAAAVVFYIQLWAIAGVLWLPLMTVALRWITGFLKQTFDARKGNVLVSNGVQVSPAEDTATAKRLANVAEEIAVATGGKQPGAAVCQSEAINAFIGWQQDDSGASNMTVVFTSAMASKFNRHELQAVVAHLYAHRRDFEQMFVTMAGAMYLSAFLAADLFLVLTVLNWNFGGSGDFATGPLVVLLVMGMLYGPVIAATLTHAYVMRRHRFLDDLSAVEITNDPQNLIGALRKLSQATARLEASYNMSNAHFYFDAVHDAKRRFPWQRLGTHPRADARIKALETATGS